jgi:predicted adenylyl cyclase CyaB
MEEVELKFRLSGAEDHERLRGALAGLGAQRMGAEHEENRMYDDGRLAGRGAVLRLRVVDSGRRSILTYKGPAAYAGAVKSRTEIEVDVAEAERMDALLRALGYRVGLTYEKERETWRLERAEVALDTLAFGHFCEVEGPADVITRLARELGLEEEQAETAGYPTLMERWQTSRE